MSRVFTLKLASGQTVSGAIHGSGGIVGDGPQNADRIRTAIRRATEGDPIGLYEPRPGHARMYQSYSASEAGEPIDVDLRGAELLEGK